MAVVFRITYERHGDVEADVQQMARGGLLVKVTDTSGLDLDTPARLELVLPDGSSLGADVKVLQVLGAHGVAVTASRELADNLKQRTAGHKDVPAARAARHERLAAPSPSPSPSPTPSPSPSTATATPTATATAPDKLTHAEKIQLALHGNRDQRNAILRDPNRQLHPFVLKNPQMGLDDILAIAKNAQSSPEMLKLIAERKEWFQRPQVAVALARNPKTPADVAVRALDYTPIDVLRQLAKGGALPAVVQAARKKVIK